MIGISKEDGDTILEEFLVNVSKKNGGKRCAEEAYKIMDSYSDSQLVITLIIINSMKQQNLIPEHIMDFEVRIASALATMFSTCDKEDVPIQLQGLFDGSEDEIIENFSQNKKLCFAIQQFVSAYYNYDLFEAKYPEISKSL